ncbi:hypothetical protein DFP72DRAFT_856655 [Ephemerocybe angulata]|uniref:Uncharacterized protein n=1 Tax=Ephemerocybe angulata TaxID=980116 RepID=A0A8H6HDX3_9AGAR|nr:hypothetical protein DFP72DRAFT_856655 [Tulosesus angulatus]
MTLLATLKDTVLLPPAMTYPVNLVINAPGSSRVSMQYLVAEAVGVLTLLTYILTTILSAQARHIAPAVVMEISKSRPQFNCVVSASFLTNGHTLEELGDLDVPIARNHSGCSVL